MKAIYHPHNGTIASGWQPPGLDLHGRPLYPAQLVPQDDPRSRFTFIAGKAFDINERKDPFLAEFVRTCREFQIVNRNRHPDAWESNNGTT
jgi:hypothetical protein